MTGKAAHSGTRVSPARDLLPYFYAQVSDAVAELGIAPDPRTTRYLGELLAELAVSRGMPTISTPLVDLLAWAMDGIGAERAYRLRYLGDVSLFVCGFFPGSFERRGLSYTYVVAMGRGAYGQVGSAVELRSGTSGGAVFRLLAERFRDLARVLDEVRERGSHRTQGGVDALVERWRVTRSPRIAHRLTRLGLPIDGRGSRSGPSN